MSPAPEHTPARGFWTPQAARMSRTRDSTAMTMSERKMRSPLHHSDLYHIIHKVPCGNSPYVRAKHVQLVEKDPDRAVSLFWAAINSGDRVDSALKDMAVVMKQLNRSDEAIEAIKSFRHLCRDDSQDSLDNLLLELYKKSGRVEEETELLERQLRNFELERGFSGKLTKSARCQGKKIEVTVEQEKARVLGNLAWVHLQQHNYGIAEGYYRKALALKSDKNKKCNLAICLMNMDRMAEAKSLLQDVKDSFENGEAEESYLKSYERAMKILTEIESRQAPDTRLNSEDSFHLYDTQASEQLYRSKITVKFSPEIRCTRGLFTQPRDFKGEQRKGRYGENMAPIPVRRLSFDNNVNKDLTQNMNGDKQVALTDECSENKRRLGQDLIHGLHEFITKKGGMGQDSSISRAKTNWADIVEEEDEADR